MLSRVKLQFPEIRQALVEIDDQKLSVDDLIAVGKSLPTSEEVWMYDPSLACIADGLADCCSQGVFQYTGVC